MNKKFFYVGLILANMGLMPSCVSKDTRHMSVNEKHVDEFGSVWTYVDESYPYWNIYNESNNTYCRYYPYSGIFTDNAKDRSQITKPDFVSEGMRQRANIQQTRADNVSTRPRTEHHREYVYRDNGVGNFASGMLIGMMLSPNYNSPSYGYGYSTHTHTRTVREIRYVPSSTSTTPYKAPHNKTNTAVSTRSGSGFGTTASTPKTTTSSFGSAVTNSTSKIKNIPNSSNSSRSMSATRSSSSRSSSRSSGGFGSAGRSTGSGS